MKKIVFAFLILVATVFVLDGVAFSQVHYKSGTRHRYHSRHHYNRSSSTTWQARVQRCSGGVSRLIRVSARDAVDATRKIKARYRRITHAGCVRIVSGTLRRAGSYNHSNHNRASAVITWQARVGRCSGGVSRVIRVSARNSSEARRRIKETYRRRTHAGCVKIFPGTLRRFRRFR